MSDQGDDTNGTRSEHQEDPGAEEQSFAECAQENGLEVVGQKDTGATQEVTEVKDVEQQPATGENVADEDSDVDDEQTTAAKTEAPETQASAPVVKEDSPSPQEPEVKQEERQSDDEVVKPKEIEKDEEWKARGKHIFILTSAGKPIFTRWGDESDFPELFGVLQILTAMVSSTQNLGGLRTGTPDCLRRVTLGTSHQMYFLTEGELQYVMVTRTRESPSNCLRQLRQLHHQLIAVIPTLNKALRKNPSYDVRTLFNHGDINVMRALIKRLNNEPGYMFRGIQPLGMPSAIREEVGNIVVNHGYGGESHLWTILLYGSHVVSFVAPEDENLHAEDVLLVINFAQVCSARAGQVWAPLCLPHYNSSGYLWCFASRVEEIRKLIDQEQGGGSSPGGAASLGASPRAGGESADGGPKLVLVQVAIGQEAFPELRRSAMDVVHTLTSEAGVDLMQQVEQCASTTPLPIDTSVLGSAAADLQFFMFYSSRQQLVTSQLPAHLANSKTERKALLRLLVRMRDLAHRSRAKEPLLIHRSARCTIAVVLNPQGAGNVGGTTTKGTELFLVFWPSVDTEVIPQCAQSVLKWLKQIEGRAFMSPNIHW